MLHALLHGKLSESNPEPERLEDALTSTVFGTLLLADAREIVIAWIASASTLGGECGQSDCARGEWECWFWPRLAYAEPDVVLLVGGRLFVVEAKYRSGRHDGAQPPEDAEDSVADQLHRQHRCLDHIRSTRSSARSLLDQAVCTHPATVIYLVDQRRLARARREFRESASALPDVDFRLLTWQRLYALLSTSSPKARWQRDLSAYLEHCGLDAFCGFTGPDTESPAHGRALGCWRGGGSPPGRVRSIMAAVGDPSGRARTLRAWRTRRARSGVSRVSLCATATGPADRLNRWTFASLRPLGSRWFQRGESLDSAVASASAVRHFVFRA